MGYKCAVDGEHYDGKPDRVVTQVRTVKYQYPYPPPKRRRPVEPEDEDLPLRIEKETEGVEIVKEVLVHPANRAEIGSEPEIIGTVVRVCEPIVRKDKDDKFIPRDDQDD